MDQKNHLTTHSNSAYFPFILYSDYEHTQPVLGILGGHRGQINNNKKSNNDDSRNKNNKINENNGINFLFDHTLTINMIKYAHNTYDGRTRKDTVGRYIV